VRLRVETFASAQAFIDGYDAAKPGCLVLDVRMPGMSGIELQERLAAQRIRVPIIFITGHGDVQMAVRAVQAGAFDFVEKPFNDQDLLDRIQRAIARDAEPARQGPRSAAAANAVRQPDAARARSARPGRGGLSNKAVANASGSAPNRGSASRQGDGENARALVSDLVKMAMQRQGWD
jgi:two-component system response regulator FixJ